MSYRYILWRLESVEFMLRRFQSLWNMTGMTSAPLLRCLSNVVYEKFTPHLAALVLIEIFKNIYYLSMSKWLIHHIITNALSGIPHETLTVDCVIKFHWQTGEYNDKSQLNFINAILFNFAEVAVSFTLGKVLCSQNCVIYIWCQLRLLSYLLCGFTNIKSAHRVCLAITV